MMTGEDISGCQQAAFLFFPDDILNFSLSNCDSNCGYCCVHLGKKVFLSLFPCISSNGCTVSFVCITQPPVSSWPFGGGIFCCLSPMSGAVHCGTSRRASRPPPSRATRGTWWVCPWARTSGPSCRGPATPPPSCGTSGTACAGSPSRDTCPTSTPSAWVDQREGGWEGAGHGAVFLPITAFYIESFIQKQG